MAKFRKRISIAPGVKVNVSKSGVSGTFGVKGASVNVGKNGAFLNTGIPGTGIYDRTKIGDGAAGAEDEAGEEGGQNYVTIGKIGKRVFFVLFLICAGFAIVSLIRGHFIWASFQGLLGLVMLLTPPLNNMMANSMNEAEAAPPEADQPAAGEEPPEVE